MKHNLHLPEKRGLRFDWARACLALMLVELFTAQCELDLIGRVQSLYLRDWLFALQIVRLAGELALCGVAVTALNRQRERGGGP